MARFTDPRGRRLAPACLLLAAALAAGPALADDGREGALDEARSRLEASEDAYTRAVRAFGEALAERGLDETERRGAPRREG